MNSLNYRYTSNGQFPVRSLITRGRSAGENTATSIDYETGEIIEIVLNQNSLKNLSKGFKTLGVSEATRRKIARHCRILGLASEKRSVRNSKGNYVDHLCKFITLTLPSEQIHDDKFITKHILGKFLDKCRKLGLLQNYVWRAEKQKNGNIHYHILTDTFANFSLFRRIWYSALRTAGYLQTYTAKFSTMDFKTYQLQKFNAGKTIHAISSAYAHGVRCHWNEPPACHTTDISDISAVAKYVSKYISKSDAENPNIVTGRCWGASQSVSSAVSDFTTNQEFCRSWYSMGTEIMNRKLISSDFYSICLFSFNSLVAWFSDCLKTAKELLHLHFTPCQYWRNSVGLFSG